MTQDKIKEILDTLNNLQENLLSLPDDMLLRIDPRDNESVTQGCEFITRFNDSLTRFMESSSTVASQIKSQFGINPEEDDVEKESDNRQKRDRIVMELDKTAAHSLEENFTYKRPYGFVLGDAAFKGLKTWKNLYMHVLQYLQEKDSVKFDRLTSDERFISRRGNPRFSKDENDLRVPEKLHDGFYVEINFSANHLRDNILDLLAYFQIEPGEMKIYLREDRDANHCSTE